MDFSGARRGVSVVMERVLGTRTFTDEHGETRTVAIIGAASDGLGGIDTFAAAPGFDFLFSPISHIVGSRFADRIDAPGQFVDGGAGNDCLSGWWLDGGKGNDVLRATLEYTKQLIGGDGNDRIIASVGDDHWVTGNAGNDHVDGRAGNDYLDGGIGADVIVSGAGNDTINPDREFGNGGQPDCARDVVRVTRDDLGDFTDIVNALAFEEDRDQIRFGDAVRTGADFRVYKEAQSFDPETGLLLRNYDQAALTNTVLQVDQDGDGFGVGTPDATDYFLVVLDADLSLHHGYMLT
jgi:hypothetical protein